MRHEHKPEQGIHDKSHPEICIAITDQTRPKTCHPEICTNFLKLYKFQDDMFCAYKFQDETCHGSYVRVVVCMSGNFVSWLF